MMATIFSGYLQWFFRVAAVLFSGVSQRTLVWCGGEVRKFVFYKVVGHRVFSCVQVVLLCWCFLEHIFLFRSGSISGHFLVAISHLFIITFILLSTSVQSLYTCLGFLQLPHTRTLLQCPVFFSLIWLIYFFQLIYIVLFNYRSH